MTSSRISSGSAAKNDGSMPSGICELFCVDDEDASVSLVVVLLSLACGACVLFSVILCSLLSALFVGAGTFKLDAGLFVSCDVRPRIARPRNRRRLGCQV